MNPLIKELPAINLKLMSAERVLIVSPKVPVGAADWVELNRAVHPWQTEFGKMRGFVFEAPVAPGFRGINGMLNHIRFVSDHYPDVSRIAFVSDRRFLETVCILVPQTTAADIRFFSTGQRDNAVVWASAVETPLPLPRNNEIFLPQVPGF